MKGWLLDTNVISEWRKPRPDRRVVEFLSGELRSSLYTSIVCLAEIRKGIEDAPQASTRKALVSWLEQALRPYFGRNALDVTEDIVLTAMRMIDQLQKKRRAVSLVDIWIAATARHRQLCVVTRNTTDLVATGVPVLNPWTGERFNWV